MATRGAVLYFVLAELSSINYMYQWSLPWFMSTFTACIDPSKLQEQPSTASTDTEHTRGLSGTTLYYSLIAGACLFIIPT